MENIQTKIVVKYAQSGNMIKMEVTIYVTISLSLESFTFYTSSSQPFRFLLFYCKTLL
jgi:hypothetical protein